jgi:hypothetical protein
MHGVIETSLVKQNHMAAEVFNALMIDTAARRSFGSLGNLAGTFLEFGIWNIAE